MKRFSSRPSADTAAVVSYAGDLVRDWLARSATGHTAGADHLVVTMYQPDLVRDRLRGLPSRASEAAQTMQSFASALLKTPAVRQLASPPLLRDVFALKHKFPNFGEAVDSLAQATALRRSALRHCADSGTSLRRSWHTSGAGLRSASFPSTRTR